MYLIFFFIDSLASAPSTGADNANNIYTPGKSYRQNGFSCFPDTEKSVFNNAVRYITDDNSVGVHEDSARLDKRNTVLRLIFTVLVLIPLKAIHAHAQRLIYGHIKSNMKIWQVVRCPWSVVSGFTNGG